MRFAAGIACGAACLLAAGSACAQLVPGPWIVDINAGVPHLESGDFQVVGDATLGYSSTHLGGVGHGSLAAYDLSTNQSLSDNTRANGHAQAWWVFGDKAAGLRVELSGEFGVATYDSTYIPLVAAAGYFHDEDSFMERGSLLVGARLHPSDRFSAALRLGGGVQVESYTYVTLDPADPTILKDSDNTSFRGKAHLAARWRMLPDIISLRFSGDGSLFTITRNDLIVRQPAAGAAVNSTQRHFRQIDGSARLFVDGDYLTVFGLMPALFGGLDVYSLSSDAGSTFTLVPVFGIGIFGSPGSSPEAKQQADNTHEHRRTRL